MMDDVKRTILVIWFNFTTGNFELEIHSGDTDESTLLPGGKCIKKFHDKIRNLNIVAEWFERYFGVCVIRE
jgi:hypothetical protein